MDISNSTLLITGATAENGIGMALARRFQQRGSTVVVSGRSQRRLDDLSATHPEFDTIFVDVTNPDSIAAASASLRETHPELDAVMTMAGMMAPEEVLDPASLSTAEDIIVTNLLGTIRTIRAFLPQLIEQPAATIITVGSGLGFVPRADVPSYSASKAAVRSYTDAIRMQLADTRVQVMLLAPPAVRTSLTHQENMKHAMPIDEYADEVMTILLDEPGAAEILVEKVKPLRFASQRPKSPTTTICNASQSSPRTRAALDKTCCVTATGMPDATFTGPSLARHPGRGDVELAWPEPSVVLVANLGT